MPINWDVNRIYKCTNCKEMFEFVESCSDEFRKKCPSCKTDNLLLESGNIGLTTLVGLNEAKTVGALGERNFEKRKKEGTLPKQIVDPAKRKHGKKILKNPDWYIKTGRTD